MRSTLVALALVLLMASGPVSMVNNLQPENTTKNSATSTGVHDVPNW